MYDHLRVIDIQIYKNSQWVSFYKTFDDENVIYRVFITIQYQIKGEELRIIDSNGEIIDSIVILNKTKKQKIPFFKKSNNYELR